MDNASLQNLLKRLCKVMWEANVANPITYVTQISYLLFLKMLEEMDAEQADNPRNGGGKRQPIFTKVRIAGAPVDFGRLQWSVLTSDPDNARMLETLRTLLPRFALHPALSPAARALFEDSAIVIPDGATLRKAVDALKDVHLLSEDADVKGDLFEILVNDLGSQKRAAQFRTPSKARPEFWDGDIPWVAPKEMKVFRIGKSSMNVTRLAVAEGGAKLVPKPAVLMVVRGMILAKRVPVAISTRPLTINQT